MTHCHHCWNAPPTTSLCSHPLLGLQKHSKVLMTVNGRHSFLHGGIKWHAFAIYALLFQTPCVIQQQYMMGYQWEGSTSTAIPPTSTPDGIGQQNKTGGITFRTALRYWLNCCWSNSLLRQYGLYYELDIVLVSQYDIHGLPQAVYRNNLSMASGWLSFFLLAILESNF